MLLDTVQRTLSLIKMGFKFSDIVQYSRCDVSILCYCNLVKSLVNKEVSIATIKDLEAYNHTTNKEVLYGLPIMEQLIETKISTDLIIDFLRSSYKPMRLLLKPLHGVMMKNYGTKHFKKIISFFLTRHCEINEQTLPKFNYINIFTALWAKKNYNLVLDFIELNGKEAFLKTLEYKPGYFFEPQYIISHPRAYSRLKSLNIADDIIFKYGSSSIFLEYMQTIDDASFIGFVESMYGIANHFSIPTNEGIGLSSLNLVIACGSCSVVKDNIDLTHPMVRKFFSTALQNFTNSERHINYIFKNHNKLNKFFAHFHPDEMDEIMEGYQKAFSSLNNIIKSFPKVMYAIEEDGISPTSVIQLANNPQSFKETITEVASYYKWVMSESCHRKIYNQSALVILMHSQSMPANVVIGGIIAQYLTNSEATKVAMLSKTHFEGTESYIKFIAYNGKEGVRSEQFKEYCLYSNKIGIYRSHQELHR